MYISYIILDTEVLKSLYKCFDEKHKVYKDKNNALKNSCYFVDELSKFLVCMILFAIAKKIKKYSYRFLNF